MKYMKYSSISNNIVFHLFMLVLILRIFSNFNLFNYQMSVVLPIIFIPTFFFFYYKEIIKINLREIPKEVFLFSCIIINIIFVQFSQFMFYDNMVDENGRNTFDFMLAISLLAISWFLIGGILSKFEIFNQYNKFFIIFVFSLSCILTLDSFDGLFVDYYQLTAIRNDDIKIHHLSLTEPLTYIIFLLLAMGYTSKLKWIYVFLAILTFLSLGGRTAFFCLVSTIFLYELLLSNTLIFQVKIVISTLISFLLLTALNIENNIFFEKLFFKDGLSSDSSFKGRIEFLSDFFDGVTGQFAIGNPNFFIYKHNDFGTYSHNILSIYQFYGIILFILVLYVINHIARRIYFLKLIYSKNLLDVFGILMFIYVILSMLLGKSVLYGPFWFILGFFLLRLNSLKKCPIGSKI